MARGFIISVNLIHMQFDIYTFINALFRIQKSIILLYVIFVGNLLHCDCHVRPLKRWLNTFSEMPTEWSNVTCKSPSYVSEKLLSEITEDLMGCNTGEIYENDQLDITPDVKYRNIE